MLLMYFGFVAGLLCFILIPEFGADKVSLPAPRNLSVRWRDEFCLTLSWQAPEEDLGSCQVNYYIQIDELNNPGPYKRQKPEFEDCHFTEKSVKYTVQTDPMRCVDRDRSEPVSKIIPKHTEHIRDFSCYLYSTKDINCSWLTSNHVSNLQLLYRRDTDTRLTACTDYSYSDGVKSGCHLHDKQDFVSLEMDSVFFLFNGTVEGSSFQNTFKRNPRILVKALPPKLNIKQEGKNLVLRWSPPDIFFPRCWEYSLTYSKCGETHAAKKPTNFAIIRYDARCQYKIQLETMLSVTCGEGSIVRGPFEVYGQDDPTKIVVAITVPVVIFISVIVALVCLRKHKTIILPDIPEPQLIFKDIMNNNKEPKNHIHKLYVPVPEEVFIPVPEDLK